MQTAKNLPNHPNEWNLFDVGYDAQEIKEARTKMRMTNMAA